MTSNSAHGGHLADFLSPVVALRYLPEYYSVLVISFASELQYRTLTHILCFIPVKSSPVRDVYALCPNTVMCTYVRACLILLLLKHVRCSVRGHLIFMTTEYKGWLSSFTRTSPGRRTVHASEIRLSVVGTTSAIRLAARPTLETIQEIGDWSLGRGAETL